MEKKRELDADVVEEMERIAWLLRVLPPKEVREGVCRINIPHSLQRWKPPADVEVIAMLLPVLVTVLGGVKTGKLIPALREGGDVMVKRALHELFTKLTSSNRPRTRLPTPTETITINVPATDTIASPTKWSTLESDVDGPTGSMTLRLYNPYERLKLDSLVAHVKHHHRLLGMRHARALEQMLDELPGSWRKFTLLFPGAICVRQGRRVIAALSWWRDGWQLGEYWPCRGIGKNCRVVIPIDSAV